MSIRRTTAMGAILASTAAFGQAPVPVMRFEAASIRLATISSAGPARGARRRVDPSRVELLGTTLPQLIRTAYRLEPYQNVTGPDWIKRRYFDVLAKLPEGATRAQIPEMLQALLTDQLKLAIRRENREEPVCLLGVDKSGPKLHEVAADSIPEPIISHSDGRTLILRMNTAHGYLTYSRLNGTVILEAPKITLPELAGLLRKEVKAPVLDHTGLQGFYDISLYVPGAWMRPGRSMAQSEDGFPPDTPVVSSVPSALEPEGVSIFQSIRRLGLKLEKSKALIEHLVVESAVENPGEQ